MLDSDAYSKLMRGNQRIGDIVRSAEEIVMPAVVVAELMYAFRQGQRQSSASTSSGRSSTDPTSRSCRQGRSQRTATPGSWSRSGRGG